VAVLLAGCALVVAATPVATAKKDKGRGDAAVPVVVSASSAQHDDRGRGSGDSGDRGRGTRRSGGQDQGQGNARDNGGQSRRSGSGGDGGADGQNSGGQGQNGSSRGQNSGAKGQNGSGQANSGGGRGSSSGSSGTTTTTPPPVAVPATVTPAPPPVAAPTPAVSSLPAATPTTPVSRPVADTRERVPSVPGARDVGGASGGPAGAGPSAGGVAGATATAPGGGATAAAASTTAGRGPAHSSGRALARQSTDGSPVARTAARIVSVIPWPMWALIGVLAALTLALGANSWIADRQRRRLREDVGLLQSALLPAVPGVLGAVATSAAYRPADGPGAGGDFYDMFELGDGRLGVVVGDLSGHGREVLSQTALTRYTLRAYLDAGLSPRAALRTASAVLDHQLEVAFATVALATYDSRHRTLTYALAGHPPPVVIGSDGAVPPVTAAASAPLGAGMSTGARQTTLTLPGRATVCFHTDGLLEARRAGELFGEDRLEGALAHLGAAASADVLLDRVAEQCDERPDDMAACVLRLPGAPLPPGARVEELQVDRRELAGARPEQFLLACGVRPAAVPGVLAAAGAALDQADAAVLRVAAVDGSLAVDVVGPELEGLSAPPHEPANERTLS
jgi:hypothetical protein